MRGVSLVLCTARKSGESDHAMSTRFQPKKKSSGVTGNVLPISCPLGVIGNTGVTALSVLDLIPGPGGDSSNMKLAATIRFEIACTASNIL